MAETTGIDELIRRNDWRVEMMQYDQQATERLVSAYERNLRDVEANMDRLIAELKNRQADEGLTVEEFRSLEEYQELLAATKAELSDFSVILRNEMADGVEVGIDAGLDGAERVVGLFLPQAPGDTGFWARPDPQSVLNIIDFVDSPAWRQALDRFGDNAVDSLSDLLIAGVAQGRNPNQIARMISQWTTVPLSWASNMARTSQIYSARLATHAAYANNPNIVEGWMWLSAQDTRTCISCWSQHGMIFGHDQTLNDHHQGRCTPAPLVRGQNWWRDYDTGPDRFEQLSEADQRQIMGNMLYDAYRQGEVGWTDFSRPYQNDIYGEMLAANSLVGIRRGR